MGVFEAIKCALIEVANALIQHVLNNILSMIAAIISILPKMPIPIDPLNWGDFGASLAYFIPISTMVQHFVLMLGLMVLWYSYEYIMRLIKMIK